MIEKTPATAMSKAGLEPATAMILRKEGLAPPPVGLQANLPARSPELTIRALRNGQYVVKLPGTGDYLQIGEEEQFLLTQLNGETDAKTLCARHEERFGKLFSEEDLDEFLELAGEWRLLESCRAAPSRSSTGRFASAAISEPSSTQANNLLYWRRNIFDPDLLFAWLVPKLWLIWTRTFLVLTAALIVFAGALVWFSRNDLASSLQDLVRWDSLALGWIIFLLVSVLHEFAHGLTCKRYGGEVHEVGILFMYFLPCLYCDVSSAWLFPEKSKRMWVMFTGVYFELVLWSLAVMVWQLTFPQTAANRIALLVLSLCGLQTLLNLVPILKLDGYFLLSDWIEIPNLHQRAMEYLTAQSRWLFLGAERPRYDPAGKFLSAFGLLCWLGALAAVGLVLAGVFQLAGPEVSLVLCFAVAMGAILHSRDIWKGLLGMKPGRMFFVRSGRAIVWGLLIVAIVITLRFVEVEDRVGGPFEIRPMNRADLRSPEDGFLVEVLVVEGDNVTCGQTVARLQIPDLESRRKQKKLEADEIAARLRLLEAGTRPEEIAELRDRVARASDWRDLAKLDLSQNREALAAELDRLEHQIAQYQAEVANAGDTLQRLELLAERQAVSEQELKEAQRRADVANSQLAQAQSQAALRQALETRESLSGLDSKDELARRENELADLIADLKLMEMGNRREEIEAERSHLARLREEEENLNQLAARLVLKSPLSGVVTTPRLREKCGQFLHQGDLVCVVEDTSYLKLEILLNEQDASATNTGQRVELRARALPRDVFRTDVSRLAPAAVKGEVQSTLAAYCEIENRNGDLRSGMTGFARVFTGRRPIGQILADRAIRLVRTQYWFWPW